MNINIKNSRVQFEEVGSLSQVLGLTIQRYSYGGFNPLVEKSSDKDVVKSFDVGKSCKNGVFYKEERKVYGSLIATVQGLQGEDAVEKIEEIEESEDIEGVYRKKGGWAKRGFRGNYEDQHEKKKYKRPHKRNKPPPQKRGKF